MSQNTAVFTFNCFKNLQINTNPDNLGIKTFCFDFSGNIASGDRGLPLNFRQVSYYCNAPNYNCLTYIIYDDIKPTLSTNFFGHHIIQSGLSYSIGTSFFRKNSISGKVYIICFEAASPPILDTLESFQLLITFSS